MLNFAKADWRCRTWLDDDRVHTAERGKRDAGARLAQDLRYEQLLGRFEVCEHFKRGSDSRGCLGAVEEMGVDPHRHPGICVAEVGGDLDGREALPDQE